MVFSLAAGLVNLRQKFRICFNCCFFPHLFAILTVEVFGSFQNRQVELWYSVEGYLGVPLRHVVYQHAAALEAQHTAGTLIDEAVKLCR